MQAACLTKTRRWNEWQIERRNGALCMRLRRQRRRRQKAKQQDEWMCCGVKRHKWNRNMCRYSVQRTNNRWIKSLTVRIWICVCRKLGFGIRCLRIQDGYIHRLGEVSTVGGKDNSSDDGMTCARVVPMQIMLTFRIITARLRRRRKNALNSKTVWAVAVAEVASCHLIWVKWLLNLLKVLH